MAKNKRLYLLVLYRPDGCTTSMGCIMDRWRSEFEFHENISYEDAFVLVRNKLAQSPEWEFHLFEDNETVFDLNDDGDMPWDGLSDAVAEERDRLLRLGEEKKARAKKKQTEAKAARELAEYERLKQKFEREGSHEGSS